MTTRSSLRRTVTVGIVGILVAVLTGCTGRGGGYLPPNALFTGQASFGFEFSCERSSKSTSPNPKPGQLRLQLSYTEQGASPFNISPFSIHGIADTIDPVLESAICIGQNPPPDGSTLIFLGRYRTTSSGPGDFPAACSDKRTPTPSLCRFEVIVTDNDRNRAPSAGDSFTISLSSSTVLGSELEPGTVFYTRSGLLEGGNLTVK